MIAVEAEKTARAAAIGSETKLFRVPKVLAADPERGTLEIERIPDLVSIRHVLLQQEDAGGLMSDIGHALAVIHERLVLPEAMRVPLRRPFAAPELGMDVVLHGDFNSHNLFIVGSTGELLITDWEVSFQAHRLRDPEPHELPTIGPRYFDLGWFIISLFLRTWYGFGRIPKASTHAKRFLGSYFSAAGPSARSERFAAYLDALAVERRKIERIAYPRAFRWRHPRSPLPWYGSVRAFASSLGER